MHHLLSPYMYEINTYQHKWHDQSTFGQFCFDGTEYSSEAMEKQTS